MKECSSERKAETQRAKSAAGRIELDELGETRESKRRKEWTLSGWLSKGVGRVAEEFVAAIMPGWVIELLLLVKA
jgi:hypothetical protein